MRCVKVEIRLLTWAKSERAKSKNKLIGATKRDASWASAATLK